MGQPKDRLTVSAAELLIVEGQRDLYRDALVAIRDDPHQVYVYDMRKPQSELDGQYHIGVADGHRCAAQKARGALDQIGQPSSASDVKDTKTRERSSTGRAADCGSADPGSSPGAHTDREKKEILLAKGWVNEGKGRWHHPGFDDDTWHTFYVAWEERDNTTEVSRTADAENGPTDAVPFKEACDDALDVLQIAMDEEKERMGHPPRHENCVTREGSTCMYLADGTKIVLQRISTTGPAPNAEMVHKKQEVLRALEARMGQPKDARALSFDEMVLACRNVGVDLNCDACSTAFYTGGIMTEQHSCSKRPLADFCRYAPINHEQR